MIVYGRLDKVQLYFHVTTENQFCYKFDYSVSNNLFNYLLKLKYVEFLMT